MNNVNAQAIARVAKRRDVISEKVRNKILAAEAMDDANDILFEHLCSQATLEDLRTLCSIMKEAKGYSNMISFGAELQRWLEEVAGNDVMYLCLQDHVAYLTIGTLVHCLHVQYIIDTRGYMQVYQWAHALAFEGSDLILDEDVWLLRPSFDRQRTLQ